LVATAEALSEQLAENAERHDADGRYPIEQVGLLQQANYFVAPIPEQFGGQGVNSAHDLLVASSRLARGEPSITLGLNMHLVVVLNMVRRWRVACSRGHARRTDAYARSLERIARDRTIFAAAVSEPSQHLTRPAANATRNGSGWVLNGRKIFCSMAPAATVLLTSASYQDPAGNQMYGYAEVPVETDGVLIHDDWDALGMRASGSNSVSFRDVHLPELALRGGFPVGSALGYIERNFTNGLFHASASLGIAESAHAYIVARLARKEAGGGAPEQMLLADNVIALTAVRATFERAAMLVDAFDQARLYSDATPDDWHAIFSEVQAAKTFVNDTAASIVDRALMLSGGAGYMRSHPLSRAYRDVRAGAFMQPLGALRAYEYLAQASLGLQPSLS
jgi:alkylation response protein AidB-like acyl-CoA dehydrogenase